MQYEFYITTDCNRNCTFCKIPKTKFYANIVQADKFYELVKEEQNSSKDAYELNFFGGEPLLNFDVLVHLIDKFKDDSRCLMNMTTNGDFLLLHEDSMQLHRIDNLTVSAYDFFIDSSKYCKINDIFQNMTLTYTFTQDDIVKINDFFDKCNEMQIKCKTVLSHTKSSWKNISLENLYSILENAYRHQLEYCLNKYSRSKEFEMQITLKQAFLRLLQAMYYNNTLEDIWCICGDKKTFYNGNFIGKCLILEHNYDINLAVPDMCKKCQYRKACTKSCYFERLDNAIDDKLCLIEKVKFDAICNFILDKKDNIQFKSMLNEYLLKCCII